MISSRSDDGHCPPRLPELYPEVAGAGCLGAALARAAAGDGAVLDAGPGDAGPLLSARTPAGSPQCAPLDVRLDLAVRRFTVSGRHRGILSAVGSTADLGDVAGVAVAWAAGTHPVDVRARFPFLTTEIAAARERGDAAAVVEIGWRDLRAVWRRTAGRNAHREGYPGTLALVEAVPAVPALRQLYPFTSHFTLCLSSCTSFPFAVRVPVVQPLGHGRYRVRPFRSGVALAETDSVAEAVALVAAHAPADLGPALVGDACRLGLDHGPCPQCPRP
jgi:hypothetical protein